MFGGLFSAADVTPTADDLSLVIPTHSFVSLTRIRAERPLDGSGAFETDAGNRSYVLDGGTREAINRAEMAQQRDFFGRADAGDLVKGRFADQTLAQVAVIVDSKAMGLVT